MNTTGLTLHSDVDYKNSNTDSTSAYTALKTYIWQKKQKNAVVPSWS